MKIYLGSQSPRRKELLSSLGYSFEVVNIQCEEIIPENIATNNVAGYLSKLKAEHFRDLEENEILITADTIVAIGNEILGKPKSEKEAKDMLLSLSGKEHQVYTGVSLKTKYETFTETDRADVTLSDLSEEEIDFYIKNYHPMDKAGAYGIQEWLGMAKITKINGSFYTIMGFPTAIVYRLLKNIENAFRTK